MKNNGLGRGLDAIFFDNQATFSEENKDSVAKIKLSLIDPRSEQPRKQFDEEALEGLANSIRENGLLQPILVREYGFGRYQIIAGERRFRASKLAGLTEIPALVLTKTDEETAKIALIENIQREDLNPIEEAAAYRSLMKEHGMTQESLAKELGKSRSALANAMRLLDLPEEVLDLVIGGDLSAGHARTLLGLNRKEDMLPLAGECIDKDLSVRALEREVARRNKQNPDEEAPEKAPIVDYFRELELRMQSHLGRKVKIEAKARKKTLTLYYEDNEDLQELLATICGKEFAEEE